MTTGCESLGDAGAQQIRYRLVFAFAVLIADIAAVLTFFRYDALRVFASQANLSCRLLGVEYRVCKFFEGNGVPRSRFLSLSIIAAILALGH